MQTISFVHVADLHLGEPVKGWKWNKEDIWKRQEEYLQTFERIISFVKDRSIPFLLIAGDFLEHGFVTTDLYHFVMTQLEKIPETRIFISPGNHDPFREDSAYQREIWPENVYIFSDQWETLYFPEYNLHISGRGFADFSDRESTLPQTIEEKSFHIYVVHGDFKEEDSVYFSITEQALWNHEVDYVALGHIHKRQSYRLKNGKQTLIHYPGSPEARSWKETGARFLTYGKIDELGVSIEDVSIHTKKYEQIEIDITKSVTLAHIEQQIQTQLSEISENDYITIQLVGRTSVGADDKNWIKKLAFVLSRTFEWIFLEDKTLPDYDLKRLRSQKNLLSTFIELMEMRISKETDEKKKRILETALYRGIDAMEKEAIIS